MGRARHRLCNGDGNNRRRLDASSRCGLIAEISAHAVAAAAAERGLVVVVVLSRVLMAASSSTCLSSLWLLLLLYSSRTPPTAINKSALNHSCLD